ncbi:mgtC family protein [Collimonas arenae]|uniref:Protein MgtC n=1 Tax=Collimonas arenae TaxID=279058 RepID=A0A127QHQ6_9BURK|nr:mgtC family protein [Collimonas arenae]AMP09599.1 mgtC family protein [Collimonas arenae]
MNMLLLDSLAAYWSAPEVAANVLIFFNLLGALFLGMLIGYERAYHGRAAGMRTYGLVCMASAGLTVFVGYPALWYGGHVGLSLNPDPTRVVQGVVTGIGFLGAGVIMKEGLNIRGLTTAASIWAASAIGILVGVGFYIAAISLTLLSATCMVWVAKLENWLPSRAGVAILVEFEKGFVPHEDALRELAIQHGYEIVKDSLSISSHDRHAKWHFIAVALDSKKGTSVSELARMMNSYEAVENFELTHCRN